MKARKRVPDVMQVPDLAEYLHLSQAKVWELKGDFKVPFTVIPSRKSSKKTRGAVRFYKPVIDQWLVDMTVRSPEDARRLQDGRRSENKEVV
jgi:hypothetical protein